jgi:hypothetical protein
MIPAGGFGAPPDPPREAHTSPVEGPRVPHLDVLHLRGVDRGLNMRIRCRSHLAAWSRGLPRMCRSPGPMGHHVQSLAPPRDPCDRGWQRPLVAGQGTLDAPELLGRRDACPRLRNRNGPLRTVAIEKLYYPSTFDDAVCAYASRGETNPAPS